MLAQWFSTRNNRTLNTKQPKRNKNINIKHKRDTKHKNTNQPQQSNVKGKNWYNATVTTETVKQSTKSSISAQAQLVIGTTHK